MSPLKKNTCDDAVAALEAALCIIESMSVQKSDSGATIWIKPDGTYMCVSITPDDAAKIKGAVYVGGKCSDLVFH